MNKPKSDIEIARAAKMKPIKDILAKLNVPDEPNTFSPMGRHIAKLNFEYIDKLNKQINIYNFPWKIKGVNQANQNTVHIIVRV